MSSPYALPQYGSGQYGNPPIEVLALGYYMNLLTSEYRNSPKLVAFLLMLLKKLDDISQCQVALDMAFDVDNAVGPQLDDDGAIVGVNRQLRESVTVGPTTYTEFPDSSFRILVKLFIAMDQWNGTLPGAYAIWNTVFGQDAYGIVIQDNQDMSMFIVLLEPPTDPLILAIFTQGYFALVPAGVNMLGFYQPSLPYPTTPVFAWGIENGEFAGWGSGAWVEPLGS